MGDKSFAVGIDFGTSTSEVCVFRDGKPQPVGDPASRSKSPVTPSLVAVTPRGELVVGEAARNCVDVEGSGVREVKRLMGTGQRVRLAGEEYRPEEVAAIILRQLRENAEALLGEPVKEVVLSVPANFPDAARQATMDAGELAGLSVVRLINEPTAAALAFGIHNMDADEQLAVCDFGGGTLDVSVLDMMSGVLDVQCSTGDPSLGGKDFDDAMTGLLLARFKKAYAGFEPGDRHRRVLKDHSEAAKIALSKRESHAVLVHNFSVVAGEPVDLEVEVTRKEFEEVSRGLLDRARACVQKAMDARTAKDRPITRALLVGGATYMPAVRKMVEEVFGVRPQTDVDPDLAVSQGAAVQAAIAAGLAGENPLILADVAPFGLGVDTIAIGEAGPALVYDPLILPNEKVPHRVRKTYTLLHREQDRVKICLYQDPTGAARYPEDAHFTGVKATITCIPSSRSGKPHPVLVDFAYDVSGIVRLAAAIPSTGQSAKISYRVSSARMGEEDKAEARSRVEGLWRMNPAAREHEAVIAKAERILDHVVGEKKEGLENLLADLKSALAAGDRDGARRSADALVDFLFDLEN